MAVFFELRFILLLVGLLLREDFTLANASTQSNLTSTTPSQTTSNNQTSEGIQTSEATGISTTGSPSHTQLEHSNNAPEDKAKNNETSVSPPLSTTPQHKVPNTTSNTTATNIKTSVSPPLNTTPQHTVPNTTSNTTATGISTTGSLSRTQLEHSNNAPEDKAKNNETSVSPPLSTTPQHKVPNTTSNTTATAIKTSVSPPLSTTPQHTVSNTTSNTTATAISTTGSPSHTQLEHSNNAPEDKAKNNETSVSPPLSTTPQHTVSNTTSNTTAKNNETSVSPPLSTTPQHKVPNTTSNTTATNIKTSVSPPLNTTPQHTVPNTTSNTTATAIKTSVSPPLSTTPQHTVSNTTSNTTAKNNETSVSPPLSTTPQHTVSNTTSNTTATNIKTSVSPPLNTTNQHTVSNTTSDTTATGISTTGSPSRTQLEHSNNAPEDKPKNNETSVSPPLSTTPPHTVSTTTPHTTATGISTTGSPSHTQLEHSNNPSENKATENKPAVSPPLSTTLQHTLSNTFSDTTATDIETSVSPPLSTTRQHTFSNTTSDRTGNVSTTKGDISHTVTSSTATPTNFSTTAALPTCNFAVKKDHSHVIVETQGFTSDFITVIDDLNHNFTISEQSNTTFWINITQLKPCSKYTFTFDQSCKPKSPDLQYTTGKISKEEVTVYSNETSLCFQAWSLKTCIDKPKDKGYCEYHNVTFEGSERCPDSTPLSIYLPPEKPKLNHTDMIPVTIGWKNKPGDSCKDLTYNCKDSNGDVSVDKILPYHNYECTGIYSDENHTIKSEVLPININCDVRDVTKFHASNTSITVLWDITTDKCNCSKLSREVKYSVKDKNNWNPHPKYSGTSNCKESWTITDLLPFKDYELYLKTTVEGFIVSDITVPQKTEAGSPKLIKTTVKLTSHNAFDVSCLLEDWNGDPGQSYTELYNDGILERNQTSQTGKNCSFSFSNLYYSTNYKIKVCARNKNGIVTHQILHKETKYNDRAVLGFLGFLICLTSVALLFVVYKIWLLKREKLRDDCEMDLLPPNALLQVEPINAEALVETYKKKRADESRLFMDEFQSIPRIFSNFSVKEAKKAENQTKNRYIDILPYDYNRVQLSNGGIHDYINASFIEGYKESNKYIAAQGPKDETVGDFWRMIWEQQSSVIVMVTRCDEGNKNKCAQYWPSLERETEIFDELVVKIKGEEKCPDYIIRHLSLLNKKEKVAERDVTQIQFISWPDHGVPADPGLLLKLRRRVNSFKNVFSGPIVIHCSAGVGRTGTYICIDAMIESLEAEGRVDIYGYVARLRRQRCLMVQVEAQYVLIHAALIEYNQFGETEISLSDFHSVVNTLKQSETNESSLMEMEFQRLPKFKNYRASNAANTEENKKKNRYSSIVPYDFNRVAIKVNEDASHDSDYEDEDYSSDEEDEAPTKYINASYLDGYWFPNSLITAQGPLPDTVADFLHMLYQKRVKAVFMLSECTENDKEFCSPYWANEKTTYEEMTVEVKETESFPTYIRQCLEIQHKVKKETHKVEQYQFLKWAGRELPADPKDLIDMMRSARKSCASSSTNNLPFVVHCNDGSSRSGIFCALWKLLDSAETEKLVDVFQVAKDLRKARLGMITTFEQYQFLYTALELAFPVQNGEVKRAASPDTVQVINESTALISTGEADHATETDTKADNATASSEEGASTNHNIPETGPNESTANGPTVTVEG